LAVTVIIFTCCVVHISGKHQDNLGSAYQGLSNMRDKEQNLKEAIAAYAEALKVRTLNAFPVDYAIALTSYLVLVRHARGLLKASFRSRLTTCLPTDRRTPLGV